MIKSLSLISGKGGSGKTTIALSMASLLSSCDIRVLLVDCDMSTNGATYFYEELVTNDDQFRCLSFSKIIQMAIDASDDDSIIDTEFVISECRDNYRLLQINDNFSFLPSITRFHDGDEGITDRFHFDVVEDIMKAIANDFDIVIYDCQAGFTEVLKPVLNISDSCLTVMEADAISSSAIRNLFLKIGTRLEKKKLYQVFNKATDEEYNTYSRISGGTLFTNIETIRFDWKVRRAFAVAQIPDMMSTSARFGETIYNICRVIFKAPDVSKKLVQYEYIIKRNSILEKKAEIENLMVDSKIEGSYSNDTNFVIRLITLMIASLGTITTIVGMKGEVFRGFSAVQMAVIGALVINVSFITLLYVKLQEKRTQRKKYEMYEEKLGEIRKQLKDIDTKLEKFQK